METLLYLLVRSVVAVLQALPLKAVARLGRGGGTLAWFLDARHRRMVIENLGKCFPEKGAAEILLIAKENFRRIGEGYASAIKTSSMPLEAVLECCTVSGLEKLPTFVPPQPPRNCIVAIGHFANFELNAIMAKITPGWRPATTYRGIRQKKLDGLLKELREKSGCTFYERRSDARLLQAELNRGGLLLGLLSDQHAGRGGVLGDFFGRPASTTGAPAIFSLRYDAWLFTSICYRTGLAQWEIEVGERIPTVVNGENRSVEEITADINLAFEKAIRRDPANWFWVHNRWKVVKSKPE